MKKQFLLLFTLSILLLFNACQKEVSFELDGASNSSGSLQGDGAGECLPKTVQGVYEVGKALDPATNFIDVQVNTTVAGNYRIYSDTVNGIAFQANGNFANTGINTVTLTGSGTPTDAGNHTFLLVYDSSQCTVTISTLSQGGGGGQAVYTLAGAPDACLNFALAGTYVAGVALTNANTVAINVDVTVAGTYTITTAVSNGMTFTATGSFANIGQQTVTLTGTGSPSTEGSTNIPVTFGTSTCSFAINVAPATGQTFDYFPLTVASNWSYQFNDDANDSILIRSKAGTVNLGGNDYNVFEGNPGSGFVNVGFYRKVGSDYHSYIDAGAYFQFDSPQNIDYIFLKDNIAAGTGWQTNTISGAISGTPISIRITFTIEQKDVTVTIGGVDYPNTIIVIEKYEVFNGTSWLDATSVVGYYKSYYSRSVGLIKQEYYYEDGNANPPLDYKQDIRRYQVF